MTNKLNPRQQAAVEYLGGPLLVLAGAGSGKTRVITHKIAWLIKQCDIGARHITAVTFTNKAAREMKSRVGELLGGSEGSGLTVSTFHNLGLNILRREHKHLGYKAGFSIFDQQDSESLLKELLRKDNVDDELLKQAQWAISDWKNNLITPEQASSRAKDALELANAMRYSAYQRNLKAYNAVDFDDLIMQPALLFGEHPEVLERWQNRIRHLLVDEYQDTNASQYQLVRQLVGVRGGLTVVGDDDQSIYAWRGARPQNLAQLKEDYPNLKLIKLEQNYRSTGNILHAANTLIANNPHVFEKRLWSEIGNGEPLRMIVCKDEHHEAERVVSEIIHHRYRGNAPLSDYAILYRGNHQSRLFEKALREQGLAYFISGGTSFFARTEIKDVMSYLRLLTNPDDDTAFLRIVNTPRRQIGPGTLEKLGNYATEREISLLAACDEFGLEASLQPRALSALREFSAWVWRFARKAEEDDPIETIRQMLKEIDYEDWLREKSSSDKVAERRIENIEELIDWLKKLRDKDDERNLTDMINHLILMDVLERQNEDEAGDRIALMTLHAAKGLEFPHVFLVGMEEELLPHRTSIEEDNIEEERRLAYVGITRAQRSLTMSAAAKRRRFGETIDCDPSRFLDELPKDILKWEGVGNPLSSEEQKERGSAHLANLKSLLG